MHRIYRQASAPVKKTLSILASTVAFCLMSALARCVSHIHGGSNNGVDTMTMQQGRVDCVTSKATESMT